MYLGTREFTATNSKQSRALFSEALAATVSALTALNRNVFIIGSIPEVGRDVPIELAKARWRGQTIDLRTKYATYLDRQRHVHAALSNAKVNAYLDPSTHFCQSDVCEVLDAQGLPLYFDHNHLSSLGATRLQPLFELVLSHTNENELTEQD